MRININNILLLSITLIFFSACSEDDSPGKTSKWKILGRGISEGTASFTAVHIDAAGNPVVAYRDEANGGKMTVQRYIDSQWEIVGTKGFTDGPVCEITISEYDGILYAGFKDADVDSAGSPSVMKYTGSGWSYVGTRQHPSEEVPADSSYWNRNLAFHVINGEKMYIAFVDADNSSLIVYLIDGNTWTGMSPVITNVSGNIAIHALSSSAVYVAYTLNPAMGSCVKYNGSSWSNVGGVFTTNGGRSLSLRVFEDTPYIAYSEIAGDTDYCGDDTVDPDKAIVKKFNGDEWEPAGDIISESTATEVTLDTDDSLYICYMDWAGVGSPTIQKFNGTAWEVIDRSIISTGTHYISMAVYNRRPVVAFIENEGDDSGKVTVMRYR